MSDRISAAQLAEIETPRHSAELLAKVETRAREGVVECDEMRPDELRPMSAEDYRSWCIRVLELVADVREAWGEAEAAARALREICDAISPEVEATTAEQADRLAAAYNVARALVGSENRKADE